MSCYKDGGCGIYEMYSCYECPASKPEYLKRKSREPQRLQAIGNLHDVAKQILDDEVVILLRMEHDKYLMEELYTTPCQMFNVGAMMPWMDYTPRTLDEIIAANSHNEAVRNK